MEIKIPNNWIPRDEQRPVWDYMENGGLRAALVAHRRFGKDDIALHFTATQMQTNIGNYWHMLPQYNQGRKVIWNAVNPKTSKRRIDEAFPKALRARTNNTEMLIEQRNGSVWQIVGSDNYDSIVGAPPRGIVFSEWALANPMAWPYLEPILEENGGWALFVYTSRGANHGKTFHDNAVASDHWFGAKITAHETDVFTEEQLERIRAGLMANYGDELGRALYAQEYECSFEGAVFGAYYSKQMRDAREQGRITQVPTGFGLEHYAKVLRDKPYVYGNHWMPHDADARVQSPGMIARTPKEMAEDLGISPVKIVQRARNMDLILKVQIPAARNKLAQCWFDEDKCKQGISCLENYSAEYDEEKKKLSNRPRHDWACHGADAFRTWAVGWEEESPDLQLPAMGTRGMPQPEAWMGN